jgi:hypothetical protein
MTTSRVRKPKAGLLPVERIERSIHVVRGQKVMPSNALADLYGVESRALVQAVKRNIDRFPPDFMFQLTRREFNDLKSQFVILAATHSPRATPYAFTEFGIAMLSSVLNSRRAIAVNIEIMRAFVRLRQLIATHDDLRRKIEELEEKYDEQFAVVFDAIRQLMDDSGDDQSMPRIGFQTESGALARAQKARPSAKARARQP